MDGKWYTNWINLAGTAFVCVAMTGCTTMQPNSSWSLFGANAQSNGDDSAATVPQETFTIEFQSTNGKSKTTERPLTNELHVQEAIAEVNGFRRYSRFAIELHRQTPQGGWHRMGIDYASSTQRVEPEFDYVLRPGDRLVILESSQTFLDDAMNAVLEPIGLDSIIPSKPRTKLPSRFRVEG